MRQSFQVLAKYVPSIKFVGGPHPIIKSTSAIPQPHPCAPDKLLPSTGASAGASAGSSKSIYTARSQLSLRFRYPTIDELEIDDVISGGAETLVK